MHTTLFLGLLAVAACGSEVKTVEKIGSLPQYSAFHDVETLANPALKSAVDAVVMLNVGSGSGTGFFLNDSGKLLTNNHVLGVKNCPKTGCFIRMYQDYELGRGSKEPLDVFALPLVIDARLDASIVQLYQEDKTTPLVTPSFLTLTADNGPALMNQKVYLIGHPGAGLKKWAEGQVYDLSGDWVIADYFSIPGTSGSPVLNTKGQVVGLNHRISGSAASITKDGFQESAYFSDAAALATVINGSTSGLALLDFTAFKSRDDVTIDEEALYNAHQSTVQVTDQGPTLAKPVDLKVLDALAASCDAGLALTTFDDPDAFDESLAACQAATKWIECVEVAQEVVPFKSCPRGDERQKWQDRAAKASANYRDFWKGTIDYDSVRNAGRFSDSDQEAGQLTVAAYNAELARVAPPLTPGLAGEIYSRTGAPEYGGVDLKDYLLNYEKQPYYDRYAYNVFFGLYFLYRDDVIDADQLKAILLKLLDDGNVPLGDKIELEAVAYDAGII